MKKYISIMLVVILAMSCICIPASAMENDLNGEEVTIARATGRFTMDPFTCNDPLSWSN